ncbi:MAG TPA: ABC transporter substrate-binding protein [Azospira sp.]|nr:ABC transporter substrate-binding protein [Azospira sp.]
MPRINLAQQRACLCACLCVLLLTIAGCGKSTPDSSAGAGMPSRENPFKINVAYTVQPQSTLIHVAVAKGYFAEEGLEVQPSIHTFGKASLQTLLEHKSDFATVAETPVMFSILKGEKIFVIANIEASSVNNGIVARREAGIEKMGDLRGKRIGYTPGTTSDFFLDSFLTVAGLRRADIRTIPLKPEEMLKAVADKEVDAVSTWNYPLAEITNLLGNQGRVFLDKEIYTETFNVAVQQEFVQKHPEVVRSFLRALLKAEKFVKEHREEAQSILHAATKTDPALIQTVWDAFNYQLNLDQTLVITLEDETRWAMKQHLVEQAPMPNYLDYIHTESLRAVKPDAVRIVR